jgi:hypothetical protein
VVGRAGDGEAKVTLHASGDLWVQLRIQGQNEDLLDAWQELDSVSARIEGEIAEHLGRMTVDAVTQGQIDSAMRQAERELAQAQHRLEQETLRAQERTRRAQKLAAKAARRARERIARTSRSWGVTVDTGLFGQPSRTPTRKHGPAPVSREEQLAILKMLQENKITPEEAESLLRALGD